VAIENFTYFDANGAPIEIYRALWSKPLSQLPANIAFVALCICKQKNNDNFQKIIYSRCNKNPFLWPVYVAFRIYCRGLRLGAPPTYPAAVCWDKQPSSSYKLIISRYRIIHSSAKLPFHVWHPTHLQITRKVELSLHQNDIS
jgi:hypothetical protein